MPKVLNKAAIIGPLFLLWSCNFWEAGTVGSIVLDTGVFDPTINSVATGASDIASSLDTSDRPTTEEGQRIYAANRGSVKAQQEILSATKNNVEKQWEKDAAWREGRGPSTSDQAKKADEQSNDVEARLKKLKQLEDAGVITSEEAKAQRKEILKNM